MFLFFTAVISSYSQESGCISGDCENGNGIYKSDSGEKYEGNFKNKKKDGYGTLYRADGTKDFEGNWKGGYYNGKGTLYYPNGDKYVVGIWKDDKIYNGAMYNTNGVNTVRFLNGNLLDLVARCLSGDCNNGYGVYLWKDGIVYDGNWKNGKRNGEGTTIYVFGERYEGSWNDGKEYNGSKYNFDGKRMAEYVNGEKIDIPDITLTQQYKDELVKNVQKIGCRAGNCENGYGTFAYENGNIYEGDFKANNKSGYGTLYWTNGSKYEGKWENDNFNGQGTLYYANGNKKYKGNYKEGKREGKGIFYYEDGYEFMGTWVDNLPYNGILFSASGLMAGKYVDGKLKKN